MNEINYNKEYLALYKKDLQLATKLRFNVGILNNAITGRTVSAHEVLFNESNQGLLMYSRSFLNTIFDAEAVISAFKGLVDRIVSNNSISKDLPIIDMVMVQTHETALQNLNDSKFIDEVRKLTKSTNRKIVTVSNIEPESIVSVPTKLKIKYDNFFGGNIKVETLKENINRKANEINTFQLFSDEYLRVRAKPDNNSDHDSDAVINCGKSENELNSVKLLFNVLKSHKNTKILDL